MSKKTEMTRRSFLKATGIAGAVALAGSVVAVSSTQAEAAAGNAHKPTSAKPISETRVTPKGRMFFTDDLEFSTVTAAAERIFPKDETGPGATELYVAFFIDNQLASGYGYNVREYMQGPFFPGAPTQGPQSPLKNSELILQGIKALNTQSKKSYGNNFDSITPDQQDNILKMCEAGKIPTDGFTSSYFFETLRGLVIAGVYADPIYSGNNKMGGWLQKNYPGAQMSYFAIMTDPKFINMPPVSLADMY